MKNGDVLALVGLGDVVAGDGALLVVAAADPERVPELAFCEGRIGRGRRDLQHATFGVSLRGRDRGRRAVVPDDERHLGAGELLADRARLLRIAGVVAYFKLEFLAEQAARRVDVGHGRFRAVLELGAERGVLAGHGSGDADADILRGRRAGKSQSRAQCYACKPHLVH